MATRGRHQTTSKECKRMLTKIKGIPGVVGVIIGRSYGGKSLGKNNTTGDVKIQRPVPGGLKGVMQSAKGLQEIFIRIEDGKEETTEKAISAFLDSD